MTRMKTGIRSAAGPAVLALALAAAVACGRSAPAGDAATEGSATGPSPSGTAATATGGLFSSPAPTAGRPSPSAAPVLPDGRSPAYLTGLDTTQNTVTFDLVEFLTGDAAKAEWKKEHPEDPDGPDNDYLIVNNNKKLRTLPVAADARCVVLSALGGTDTKTISFAALPAFLDQQNAGMNPTPPHIAVRPFWLTVRRGTVTGFEEQYLP